MGGSPNLSETIRTVASTDFDKVRDIAGQESLTRYALPIASASEVGPARQIEKGGNVEADRRQRGVLQQFVDTFYYGNDGQHKGRE